MTRVVFSFVYMKELKDRQNKNLRQKAKSKQTENEMVFLERKMFRKLDKHKWNDQNGISKTFWKVDKDKRNDKNGIIHLFGKSTKNRE